MNANMAKVQSLIENAFTSAVEKLAKDDVRVIFDKRLICAGCMRKRGNCNL